MKSHIRYSIVIGMVTHSLSKSPCKEELVALLLRELSSFRWQCLCQTDSSWLLKATLLKVRHPTVIYRIGSIKGQPFGQA